MDAYNFSDRNNVDLKDKWRNLQKKYGQRLSDALEELEELEELED